MARPLKNGLDYFPFDVDFFSDQKVKRLRAKYGAKGIAVYIYILCEIYKEGYQIPYTEDLILDISDEFHLSENATREIVGYLLRRRLFEPELAESVKVLTSKSIQSRWQTAKRGGSRRIEVEGRTWLLLPEETYTFLEVHPSENKSPENPSFSGINGSKSPENALKKRKGKESKVNSLSDTPVSENAAFAAFPPSWEVVQAFAEVNRIAENVAQKFYAYYQKTGWQTKNGAPVQNWQNTLCYWAQKEKARPPKVESQVPKSDNAEAYRSFIYNIDE